VRYICVEISLTVTASTAFSLVCSVLKVFKPTNIIEADYFNRGCGSNIDEIATNPYPV
tara:strand:- start:794 stop:967 length:174 start_codon:yes stop_codon:yes gene_type:complete